MKIIVFSSDKDFAIFEKGFKKNGIEVCLLVTESPKVQGRNLIKKPNPAHEYALQNNIPALAQDELDEKFLDYLSCYNPMIGFIFAYGKIIPAPVIDHFKKGILNIHFSLLPEYRGASPIQKAILDGKNESGFTVFLISKALDRGDILMEEKVEIAPDDNFDTYRAKLIEKALVGLPSQIKGYAEGKIKLGKMPQRETKYAGKIKKEDGLITEADGAEPAMRKVRAFSQWPKTYLLLDRKRLIIHSARLENNKLVLVQVQPEGRRKMNFSDFQRGYPHLLTKMPKFVSLL